MLGILDLSDAGRLFFEDIEARELYYEGERLWPELFDLTATWPDGIDYELTADFGAGDEQLEGRLK